jgi:hypothetical protein
LHGWTPGRSLPRLLWTFFVDLRSTNGH